MESLVSGELTIDLVHLPERALVQLHWLGKSIERNPGTVLDPYLMGVINFAAGLGVGLEMHFERMIRFNSATTISLILVLQEGTRRGVRLAMYFDGKVPWQRINFEALAKLAKNIGSAELRSV